MKKLLTLILTLTCVLALVGCGRTMYGKYGFLHLSNMAKYIFIGTAVVCGIISSVALRLARKS